MSGGSSAWKNVASVTVSASGSTDAPGSGIAGYEHETSTDGGANWSARRPGRLARVTAEGETLVRFRAVDDRGLHVRVEAGHGPHRPHRAERAVGCGRLGEPGSP